MILSGSVRHLRRLTIGVFVLCSLFLLSACAQQVWATDEAVQAARHNHGGAPELTLVTIMNYGSGRGDHTALFINGSERVVFDPAGSWSLATIPERNDVHFGMTYAAGASFYASHVRPSHYAVVQRLVVSPEVAEQAMALALQAGPVPPARCASATAALLRQLPGFGGIRTTFFPNVLMQNFAQIEGVQTFELHHDAPDYQTDLMRVQRPL
ncbi:hypothetical protein [Roseinatronobacter bogoriensis]|uniref:Lipoprotein n=1 Tax=Roseinatronobacter bogoriensis subsp. barguzinensis TaxID=441209 RepID=A0A2K8K8X4_9RHOB|nr:hypothetical protein [Rhodobaca]ATX65901.1 hypothetical protein BG454_08720 [Rhodobaca barguzinensis]MBB4208127.1 hypothetical protein [Rhodobaca bogoriensis DSM 18756]TDW38768.1 hypothetical protein LY39_01794 [Rhodobaca barguzinensis]TDY69194.1 hypothetical protein EV660_10474 [Rhodobaca bogoriensis DSM 18756]